MFDSSVKRGQPARFPLGKVIKGWTEGLQIMVVGEKRRFWIPANRPTATRARRTPLGMLVFDGSCSNNRRAKVPEDVAAAPKSAKKTKSGIAYRVLKKGTARSTAAEATSRCLLGWTMTARCSTARSRAACPRRSRSTADPGLDRRRAADVVGEKTRFWIRAPRLRQFAAARAPKGMLVFDIELMSIK